MRLVPLSQLQFHGCSPTDYLTEVTVVPTTFFMGQDSFYDDNHSCVVNETAFFQNNSPILQKHNRVNLK